jgi:hypothetical protein
MAHLRFDGRMRSIRQSGLNALAVSAYPCGIGPTVAPRVGLSSVCRPGRQSRLITILVTRSLLVSALSPCLNALSTSGPGSLALLALAICGLVLVGLVGLAWLILS